MSSPNASTFHLIVEHFSRNELERPPTPVLQQLSKLLGKGQSQPCHAPNPRAEIAALMGNVAPLPWAQIWLRNAGIRPKAEETCFVVEPVQMVAGMNNIAMRPLPQALNNAQLEAWIRMLQPVLAMDGAQLENINGQCLLRIPRPLKVRTTPLDEARNRDLRDCLPSGEDSGWIRRTMTECQMVLHDLSSHPTLSETGVNGVWLWGNTQDPIEPKLTSNPISCSVQLRTSDPWLAALLHLHPKAGEAAPLKIWHGSTQTTGLEATLTAQVRALWVGEVSTLAISLWKDAEMGRTWHLKRHHLLRFWSRPVKIDG